MWEAINSFLTKVDDFVWGPPLMILIIAGGILLTIRMGVLQVRKLPLALKWMVKNEEEGEGEVTSFGALCTALSATIGTEISAREQQRSEPVVRVLCSGWCLLHSSEWQPSMQKDSLQLSIVW